VVRDLWILRERLEERGLQELLREEEEQGDDDRGEWFGWTEAAWEEMGTPSVDAE